MEVRLKHDPFLNHVTPSGLVVIGGILPAAAGYYTPALRACVVGVRH